MYAGRQGCSSLTSSWPNYQAIYISTAQEREKEREIEFKAIGLETATGPVGYCCPASSTC